MTSAQIYRVLKLYEAKIEEWLAKDFWEKVPPQSRALAQLRYLQGMIPRFPDVRERREKAMLLLCFMQGAFWAQGIYTIEELEKHNSDPASKTDVARVYHNHSLMQNTPCASCGDLDGCHKWREYAEAPE